MAELLEIAFNTVHSYEQGRRTIPPHIESGVRYMFLSVITEENKRATPLLEKTLNNGATAARH
jgi:hypothetical protein